MKDFGNDKQLGFAEEAFARCVANCAPNAYTHTNRINACVRVGELEKARGAWNDMVAAGVEPNEVTHTVMIKGLAQEGLLDEATARLRRMCEDAERAGESAAARPNARTFAALLRGCVRHADPTNADACFALMRETGVAPDATAFEYLVKTRCAAMDAEGAWAARAEMEREYLDARRRRTPRWPRYPASSATRSARGRRARRQRAAVEANGAGTPEDGGGAGGYGCVGGYGSDSDGGRTGTRRTGTRRTPKTAMDGPKRRFRPRREQERAAVSSSAKRRRVAPGGGRGGALGSRVQVCRRGGGGGATRTGGRVVLRAHVESADDATGRLDFASLFENQLPDASRGVQRARRLGDGEGGGGRGEGELARD